MKKELLKGLTEELIVIESFETKEKIEEIKKQIEENIIS